MPAASEAIGTTAFGDLGMGAEQHLDGDPPAVVTQSTQQALCDLLAAVANLCDDASDR